MVTLIGSGHMIQNNTRGLLSYNYALHMDVPPDMKWILDIVNNTPWQGKFRKMISAFRAKATALTMHHSLNALNKLSIILENDTQSKQMQFCSSKNKTHVSKCTLGAYSSQYPGSSVYSHKQGMGFWQIVF